MKHHSVDKGARWPSVSVLDCGARFHGFESHLGGVLDKETL